MSRCSSSHLLRLSLAAALLSRSAAAFAQTPSPTGGIVGAVVDRQSGKPVPYADVTIEGGGAGFADADGRFRIAGLTIGERMLRVRRVGYQPNVIQVRVGSSDTIRVALDRVAIELGAVRVVRPGCDENRRTPQDALPVLLQQIRLNAERADLLRSRFDHDLVVQRVVANERFETAVGRGRVFVDTVLVDTLARSASPEWVYEPGHLVRRHAADARTGADESLAIPQLGDLGSDAFVDAHCFTYGGAATEEGMQVARIDFVPARELRGEDVSGELFLDRDSFRLVRLTMRFERSSDAAGLSVTTVDTWFRDLLPGMPVIDRVCARTLVRPVGSSSSRGTMPSNGSARAALEMQGLIDARFVGTPPGAVNVRTPPRKLRCPPGT